MQLTQFEIATLANLVPEAAEEATTFLPSLRARMTEEQIMEVLDVIKKHTDA